VDVLRREILSAVASMCLLAMLASHATAEPALDQELLSIMDEELERHQAPGMSLAVTSGRSLSHEAVAGFADREAGIPVEPDTLFQAASVSKLLTATLVLRQVERGRLGLDTPANQYLAPERWIRDRGGLPVPATLRHLLTHTSGLPVRNGDRQPGVRLEDALIGRLRTIRPPGEKIIYSNDGYALLGYLAAKADGQTFREHARTVLFEPLGMTRSSFRSPSEFRDRLAVGEGSFFGAFDRTSRVEPADHSAIVPAGGLITTAGDLLRFALLFLHEGEIDGRQILSAETVSEMTLLQVRQHPALDEGYGLGFMVRERAGRTVAWHDGGYPGASARLLLVPDAGIAIAALSNTVEIDTVAAVVGRTVDLLTGPEGAAPASDPAELRVAQGAYRFVDVLPPGDWYLNWLFNLEVDPSGSTPVLRRFPILAPLPIEARGPGRFLIHGWHFDGAIAHVDGDRLYVGIAEARRLAWWETARAFLAVTTLVALVALAALGWLSWVAVRRAFARRRAVRAGFAAGDHGR
jgi:CubicO group peptidase (beta-lactamase class C family)